MDQHLNVLNKSLFQYNQQGNSTVSYHIALYLYCNSIRIKVDIFGCSRARDFEGLFSHVKTINVTSRLDNQ